MKISSYAALVLASGGPAIASSHELQTMSEDQMETYKNKLRGQLLAMDPVLVPNVPEITFDRTSEKGEVSIPEQLDNIERLYEEFESMMVKLKEADTSEFPAFDSVKGQGAVYIEQTHGVIEELIDLLVRIEADEMARKEQREAEEEQGLVLIQPKKIHRRRAKREGRSMDEDDDEAAYEEAEQSKYHRSQAYRRARRRAMANGQGHLFDLQDAMASGDHESVEGFAHGFNARMDSHLGRRRMTEGSKMNKCKVLAGCASKMVLYDLFVYFYSDDIDPVTGRVDKTQLRFDEHDMPAKNTVVKELAADIVQNGPTDSTCDRLLQQFHRTIERDGIGEWEGGTVGQVCLAEGTTVYVDLAGMMNAMVGLEDIFDDNKETFDATLESTIGETMACARDMFNNGETGDEEFPFAADPLNSDIEQFRFPVGVNAKGHGGCDFVKMRNRGVKETALAWSIANLAKGTPENEARAAQQCKDACCGAATCTKFDHHKEQGICYFYQAPFTGELTNEPWGGSSLTSWDTNWDHYIGGTCDWVERDGEYAGHNDVSALKDHVFQRDLTKEECFQKCEEIEECNSADYGAGKDGVGGNNDCYHSSSIVPDSELRGLDYWKHYSCSLVPTVHYTAHNTATVGSTRDSFGQIISIHKPAFRFRNYEELKADYNACVVDMRSDGEANSIEDAFSCLRMITDKVSLGLSLVFGEKPSPGFVCGVKETIEDQTRGLPGYCCLDAPYQQSGDGWGEQYQCGERSTCSLVGPFFSGMSEKACSSYGGTYCPIVDCTKLHTCVSEYKEEAISQGHVAFEFYLDTAPEIVDPKDHKQCYQAREYFGYEGNFINDKQICEDVYQFRYTEDFDFMNEFFNQGNDNGFGGIPNVVLGPKGGRRNLEEGATEEYVLEAPSGAKSESEAFLGEAKWKQVNLVMTQIHQKLVQLATMVNAFECPEDFLGISQNICGAIKNILYPILSWGALILDKIIQLSKHLMAVIAAISSGDMAKIFESVQNLFKNTVTSAQFLSDQYTVLGVNNVTMHANDIQQEITATSAAATTNATATTSTGGARSLGALENTLLSEMEVRMHGLETLLHAAEDKISTLNEGKLDFEVEVVNQKPAQLLVLSPVEGDMLIQGLQDGKLVPVAFTSIVMEAGTTMITLEDSDAFISHVLVTLSKDGKDVTHLLSLI